MASQPQNLTIEISDLLLNGLTRLEQRPDRSDQIGTIFYQLSGSRGEDIERGATDDETKVFKEAADLIDALRDLEEAVDGVEPPPGARGSG